MSAVAGSLALYALNSLLQIDEVHVEKMPDGSLVVYLLTTGVHPSLAKVKTTLWALLGLPVQAVEEMEIEELQGGILKRYKIRVVLRPAWEKLRRGEGLGLIPVLLGENVVYHGGGDGWPGYA